MDELRDFFLAKNRRQAMGLFRIGSIGNAPGPAERLEEKNAVLPNVALPCLAIFLSETTPLDIRERAAGLSDRANSGIVERNLLLCGHSDVWYFVHNCEAGVRPASFCEDGSQEHLL
jgi:hypothetical protein